MAPLRNLTHATQANNLLPCKYLRIGFFLSASRRQSEQILLLAEVAEGHKKFSLGVTAFVCRNTEVTSDWENVLNIFPLSFSSHYCLLFALLHVSL